MKTNYEHGTTKCGSGIGIELDGCEIAAAIDAFLVARSFHVSGPRTITVNSKLIEAGRVYVDPSGCVITPEGEKMSGHGERSDSESLKPTELNQNQVANSIDLRPMRESHPMKVPPELVEQRALTEQYSIAPAWLLNDFATRAVQWGADQQLKKVTAWLYGKNLGGVVNQLEDAMRPKSLVEQGLEILSPAKGPVMLSTPEYRLTEFQAEILRAALKRLDMLESKNRVS